MCVGFYFIKTFLATDNVIVILKLFQMQPEKVKKLVAVIIFSQ